jgi:hypothetical protein
MRSNNISRIQRSLVALAILIFLNTSVFAQGDGFDDPGGMDTPFDGGVSLLIAAAVGYGAKKAHDEKKKRKEAAGIGKE